VGGGLGIYISMIALVHTDMNKREILGSLSHHIVFADGFDDALIGYVTILNRLIVVYDRRKCVSILMERDNMSEEDADEFMSYNVEGAYVDEQTPAFFTRIEDVEV